MATLNTESTSHANLPVAVQHLMSLPLELCHKVMKDLTLFKMLQLTNYDVPLINERIQSHPAYRAVFPTPARFLEIRSLYRLYRDIAITLQLGICHSSSPLALNLSYLPPNTFMDTDAPKSYLAGEVFHHLSRASPYVRVLSRFEPQLQPEFASATTEELQQRWQHTQAAQAAFNELKAKQLEAMASLLARHPKKLTPLQRDYGPEPFTPIAADHVIRRLRRDANKIRRSQILRKRSATFPCRYPFVFVKLCLVPHDHCLQDFLQRLERITVPKVPKDMPDVEGQSQEGGIQPASNICTDILPTVDLDPQDIQTIKKAVHGLDWVYHDPYFDRDITYQPISRTTRMKGPGEPLEFIRPSPYEWENDFRTGRRDTGRDGVDPMIAAEIEWLTAFLEACDILERLSPAQRDITIR